MAEVVKTEIVIVKEECFTEEIKEEYGQDEDPFRIKQGEGIPANILMICNRNHEYRLSHYAFI